MILSQIITLNLVNGLFATSNWETKSFGSKTVFAGTSTILDTAVFMKNVNKHYYILKLFCKRFIYFHKQTKGSNIK